MSNFLFLSARKLTNFAGITDPLTRKIASFIVGVAAESAPNVYADFAVAAIEPLFNSIGPIDLEDPVTLAARDNSVSARTYSSSLECELLSLAYMCVSGFQWEGLLNIWVIELTPMRCCRDGLDRYLFSKMLMVRVSLFLCVVVVRC